MSSFKFYLLAIFLIHLNELTAQIIIDSSFSDYEEVYNNSLFDNNQFCLVLDSVSIINSNLLNIIDTVLEQEQRCVYINQKLSLSIRSMPIDTCLSKQCFCLKFELNNINTLIGNKPIGYFVYRDFKIFLFDFNSFLKQYYSKTGIKNTFYFNYENSYDNDRYSMYFYYFIYENIYVNKVDNCR